MVRSFFSEPLKYQTDSARLSWPVFYWLPGGNAGLRVLLILSALLQEVESHQTAALDRSARATAALITEESHRTAYCTEPLTEY